jgi:hypothetical protein
VIRGARFLGFGGPVVVSALVLNMLAAHASFTYSGQGYDVSYPQCPPNSYTVPPGSSFGIIGANDGRPFTVNPCFGTEYSSPANSAYINTGYAKAYRSNITATCSQASGGNQAWAIGCSEAEYSLSRVGVTPSMWWLDVETANSWSTGNVAPNRSTIQGAISQLGTTGVPVGVYSTAAAWSRITGRNFVPSGVAGVWVPAPQCSGTSSFINGAPVWLTQKIVNNLDVDTAC